MNGLRVEQLVWMDAGCWILDTGYWMLPDFLKIKGTAGRRLLRLKKWLN